MTRNQAEQYVTDMINYGIAMTRALDDGLVEERDRLLAEANARVDEIVTE